MFWYLVEGTGVCVSGVRYLGFFFNEILQCIFQQLEFVSSHSRILCPPRLNLVNVQHFEWGAH